MLRDLRDARKKEIKRKTRISRNFESCVIDMYIYICVYIHYIFIAREEIEGIEREDFSFVAQT